jgi:mRNA-degrading endonuclease RelE of RelBE toxin-antitoxin system
MTVRLHPIPGKYLERLSEPHKGKIKEALKGLEKEPPEGDIRPLSGQSGHWRLKVDGYRALYRVENNTIFVTHIDPRGQAYKKKNRGTR